MTQGNTTNASKEEDLAQEVPINHSDAPSAQAPEEPVEMPEPEEGPEVAEAPEVAAPPEPTLEEQLAEMKGNYLRALAESEKKVTQK